MPLKDVTVTIDIQKSSKLVGLGKPVILASFPGASTYKSYGELEDVAEEFGLDTVVHKIAKTLFNQGESSPEKIAVLTYDPAGEKDKTAAEVLEKNFYNDFYFITADTQVVEEIQAIADVVEGKGVKIYGATVATKADVTTLSAKGYERTFVGFYSGVNGYFAEGLIGAVGSKDVGSATWKFKSVVGLTAEEISESDLKDIHALNAQAYVTKSGVPQSSEGVVLSGEYIDVIHSKDWIKLNIEEAVQNVFATNDKVAYTNAGISLIALAVEGVLNAAAKNDMIVVEENEPQYAITTKRRDEVEPVDRETRIYKGLSFEFQLAGAIHEAKISGSIKI